MTQSGSLVNWHIALLEVTEMALRQPYFSALLPVVLRSLYELGKDQAIGLNDGQLVKKASGKSERHPLWIRESHPRIKNVLEVNVYGLSFSRNQNIVRVPVANPNNVAQETPLSISLHEISVFSPPFVDQARAIFT